MAYKLKILQFFYQRQVVQSSEGDPKQSYSLSKTQGSYAKIKVQVGKPAFA